MECIFCKIVKKEQQADIVWEDENIIVFKDMYPKAPVHMLVVSKTHITSLNEVGEQDRDLLGRLLLVGKDVAKKLKIQQSGWKAIFNVGRGGGQVIDHLHLHVLGGWKGGETKELP